MKELTTNDTCIIIDHVDSESLSKLREIVKSQNVLTGEVIDESTTP